MLKTGWLRIASSRGAPAQALEVEAPGVGKKMPAPRPSGNNSETSGVLKGCGSAPRRVGRNPAADPRSRPIGVFDSGIGGLTVLKALAEANPHEDFIYLGDTARLPYGTKSAEVILRYSLENAAFLLARGIKMLVIACNTSSAVALDEIAGTTTIPVAGVIEPGARAVSRASRSGKIGVIGTEATIASGAYTRAIKRFRPRAEVFTRACPLLVPLVEEGWTDNEIAERTVAHYLDSLKTSGIEALLLGCTHYPLLRSVFERVLGGGVKIVDSASATAAAVREQLNAFGLARLRGAGAQSFFVTETPERFIRVGRRFLGPQVESAVRIERW